MNRKIFNKLIITVLFVLGLVLIPNYKADAAITVNVFATPSTISVGGSAKITWSSTGATSCTRTDTGASVATNDLSTGFTVYPTTTTTYTINCVGAPSAPTGLTVTPRACGVGMMDITWNAVPSVNEYLLYDDSYGIIYRGTATSFIQTGLTLGSYHNYYVVSHDSDGYSSLSSTVSGTVAGACAPRYYYYELTSCIGNPVYPDKYQTGPFIEGTYQYDDQRMGAIEPISKYYVTGMSTTPYETGNIQTSGTGRFGCMPPE